jgi:Nickel responsive protein SCO4226-like
MTTHLFLERTFGTPLTAADAHARARESGWCFEMYRVDWRASFLATSGRTMTCWFAAPDAESARAALRQSGADTRRLWAGTVHEAPEPAVPNVLVARSFEQPVALESVQAIEDAGAWCLRAHHVKFARTFFSADRKRMLCLYEAPDAESVRLAQHEAAMPVDTVWAFNRIGPDTLASDSA